VDFVVLPAKTLRGGEGQSPLAASSELRHATESTYLCDSQGPPLLLPQQLQSAFRRVVVVLGDSLEHSLGQLYMTVLVVAVAVPVRRKARFALVGDGL
jgi:hypothetical protein